MLVNGPIFRRPAAPGERLSARSPHTARRAPAFDATVATVRGGDGMKLRAHFGVLIVVTLLPMVAFDGAAPRGHRPRSGAHQADGRGPRRTGGCTEPSGPGQ